jgi:hypothetical protein
VARTELNGFLVGRSLSYWKVVARNREAWRKEIGEAKAQKRAEESTKRRIIYLESCLEFSKLRVLVKLWWNLKKIQLP